MALAPHATRIISNMLLTISTTHRPASDLGYLLHKNPANLHSFDLSFGKAHVFYPEATTERCTAALLLDVDPVGLVRGKRGQHEGGTLDQFDEKFPGWGEGPYYSVMLSGTFRLQDLLNHLYVLVPVLDAEKHYWIGQDEVEKLLRKGEGWLGSHPHKETIVKRYLPRQRQLAREALARLTEEDNLDPDATEEAHAEQETKMEEPIRLWQQRMGAVVAVLRSAEAKRVLDLGCGEGKLLRVLLEEKSFTEIVGMDVSYRSLEIASNV
jgi:Hen1-like subunit of RNA repair complex/methyltransferase family protein